MRLSRAFGAALVLAGLVLAFTSTATAQTVPVDPLPPLVTDYANYPDTDQAMLTPGCDYTGVSDVTFSVNGGTAVAGLGLLPELKAGDAVTMNWGSVAPQCVGSVISLVVKSAPEPFFNPEVDQPVAGGGYIVVRLTGTEPGSLTLVMPDLSVLGTACAYQMDAIVGVPLAVVGPSGSFYSSAERGDDRRTTLISFRNSQYEICVAQVTTTTTAPTTTTTAPTTTTTAPVAPPTTAPVTTTTAAGQSAQAAQATRTLAATGTTPWAAIAGFVGVGVGLVLLLVSFRRPLAASRRSSGS